MITAWNKWDLAENRSLQLGMRLSHSKLFVLNRNFWSVPQIREIQKWFAINKRSSGCRAKWLQLGVLTGEKNQWFAINYLDQRKENKSCKWSARKRVLQFRQGTERQALCRLAVESGTRHVSSLRLRLTDTQTDRSLPMNYLTACCLLCPAPRSLGLPQRAKAALPDYSVSAALVGSAQPAKAYYCTSQMTRNLPSTPNVPLLPYFYPLFCVSVTGDCS